MSSLSHARRPSRIALRSNEVVVTLVRTKNNEGDAYKVNLARFLLAVDEGIINRKP